MCASCRLVGAGFVAAASNSVTRISFEKICQIAVAPSWTGKDRWKTARERQVRRFRVTPRRCIRLPPKRLPPEASARTEFCQTYRCSSASDGKSSCLCLNDVQCPLFWWYLSDVSIPNIRFGSLADITASSCNACFTPKSGHSPHELPCLLCANSGFLYRSNKLYSITSSARASTVAGMSRPSALAVLRLIMSSNFAGCSIGRSPGFSPLRILSMYDAARR